MKKELKKNLFFLGLIFKNFFFNYSVLVSIIILSLFYGSLLSYMYIRDALGISLPFCIITLNLFMLGNSLFEYKKNKNFFYDKKVYNFSILFCLFLFDFLLMFTVMFLNWIFFQFGQLILFWGNIDSYIILDGPINSVNWWVFYYFLILLTIISYLIFEILYKLIKKLKNYYFTILVLMIALFISIMSYNFFYHDYLVVGPTVQITSMNINPTIKLITIIDTPTQYYDPEKHILYLYPHFNNSEMFIDGLRWWLIIINPLFVFKYLFSIVCLNYTFNYPFYLYDGIPHLGSELTIQTAYFHIKLWSGYFWFMVYPYLYISFLLIIKLGINGFWDLINKVS